MREGEIGRPFETSEVVEREEEDEVVEELRDEVVEEGWDEWALLWELCEDRELWDEEDVLLWEEELRELSWLRWEDEDEVVGLLELDEDEEEVLGTSRMFN